MQCAAALPSGRTHRNDDTRV